MGSSQGHGLSGFPVCVSFFIFDSSSFSLPMAKAGVPVFLSLPSSPLPPFFFFLNVLLLFYGGAGISFIPAVQIWWALLMQCGSIHSSVLKSPSKKNPGIWQSERELNKKYKYPETKQAQGLDCLCRLSEKSSSMFCLEWAGLCPEYTKVSMARSTAIRQFGCSCPNSGHKKVYLDTVVSYQDKWCQRQK